MEEKFKIGFIGCGRVGTSLAKYFKQHHLNVVGVYDRTKQNGLEVANFIGTSYYNDKLQLIEESNIIFITVSDTSIKTIWDEICQNENSYLHNKIFVHCSGALSSKVFSHSDQTITFCSVHPAQAFCDKYKSYLDLNKTVFTLEYDKQKHNCQINKMEQLLQTLGNKYATINADAKVKYHASCVMASNLVVALAQLATDTIEECGVEQDTARELLGSLIVGNAKNILANGPTKALTGPVDRADSTTVKAHLDQLTSTNKDIYIRLSQKLIEIAKIKNPEKNYNEIEKLLK